MSGPKYANVEGKNQYNPVTEKTKGEKSLTTPVFQDVDHQSKYVPVGDRVQGQLAMTGMKQRLKK